MNYVTEVLRWIKSKSIILNSEIKTVKKINDGYTNNIFKVLLENGQELKLRIATQNQFINRKLEFIIEANINNGDFIYYDINSGDYLRYWIDGKKINKNDFISKWNEINYFLNKLHSITPYRTKVNMPIYFDDQTQIDEKITNEFELYKNIVSTFDIRNYVLSHNDFSVGNILLVDNHLKVFDYEWASRNHPLWDICNLIKDLGLSYKQIKQIEYINLNLKKFLEIIFCVHVYTYVWTTRVEPTTKVLKYRKKMISKIQYWYDVLQRESK